MSIHSNPYQLQDQILDFPIYAPIYIWFSFILWNQLKNYKNRLSFWNDRVSIDFCGCCRFEMTIFFAAKSFLNDKRYDCRLDSQQRASNPLSSFQKDGHRHFEETVIRHIEEKSIPSFRKERGRIISKWDLSFRKVHHPSFRKGRALSFQNDSFAWDLSMMNLNDSFRNDRGSVILKWHWFWIFP